MTSKADSPIICAYATGADTVIFRVRKSSAPTNIAIPTTAKAAKSISASKLTMSTTTLKIMNVRLSPPTCAGRACGGRSSRALWVSKPFPTSPLPNLLAYPAKPLSGPRMVFRYRWYSPRSPKGGNHVKGRWFLVRGIPARTVAPINPAKVIMALCHSWAYTKPIADGHGGFAVMLARILRIVSGIAAVTALGFAVWHFRLWEKDWSTIDDGWASLIGSAVGSFLAVVGALYVAKSEERRKRKEFEEFVKVAVQNLVLQASYLEAMAREPHRIASTPEVQAGIISIQLRSLTDALAVFDREVAGSRDGSYLLRREIVALDAMLSEVRHALTIESNISQNLNNWHVGAYQVRQHAHSLLKGLGWPVPMPTVDDVVAVIKQTVAAWRNWNIPHQGTNSFGFVTDAGQHQPLHHAHA